MKQASRFCRMLAWLIDWTVCVAAFTLPLELLQRLLPDGIQIVPAAVCAFGIFTCFFCRDFLSGGRTVGKRLMKLTVVDRETGLPATGTQLLLKNLFFFLYPVDAGFLLFSGRSLGERATHTAVIRASQPAAPVPKKRFVIVAAVILALAIPFSLLLHVLLGMAKEQESYQVAYDYLVSSETFAALDTDESRISLNAFSGYTAPAGSDSRSTHEYTFLIGGESYSIICHPDETGTWQVCDTCTELE